MNPCVRQPEADRAVPAAAPVAGSLFRERLLARLVERHAISQELATKLMAWRHPGFSAHVVHGANTLTFTDVWVGEVWVASGQSNMELPLAQSKGPTEAAAAGCSGLRLFTVAKTTALEPRTDVEFRL